MIISPKEVVQKGWVTTKTGAIPEKCVQPNGLDFSLDNLFVAEGDDSFVLSETERKHKKTTSVETSPDGFFLLNPRTSYDATSEFYVEIPEGVSATLIVRSSLNRNAIFLTSGFYDSGFKGHIGFYLHNLSKTSAYIQKGTRVGQIVFYRSDSYGVYAGHYNHAMRLDPVNMTVTAPCPSIDVSWVQVGVSNGL